MCIIMTEEVVVAANSMSAKIKALLSLENLQGGLLHVLCPFSRPILKPYEYLVVKGVLVPFRWTVLDFFDYRKWQENWNRRLTGLICSATRYRSPGSPVSSSHRAHIPSFHQPIARHNLQQTG